MATLCDELRQQCDFVLIDSPAGIEQGFQNAVEGADEAIIVTTPDVAAVRDADRIVGLLEANGKGTPRLIVNRIKPDMVRRGDMLATEDVLEVLVIELLGIVPEDENIIVHTNKGIPIALDGQSPAAQAFRNIGKRILGQDVPLMTLSEESRILDRMRRLVGRG
jgi:septum site-determining protein MinD